MANAPQSKYLEEALRKKGFASMPISEKIRLRDRFVNDVRGSATGDRKAGIEEIQRLRGPYNDFEKG